MLYFNSDKFITINYTSEQILMEWSCVLFSRSWLLDQSKILKYCLWDQCRVCRWLKHGISFKYLASHVFAVGILFISENMEIKDVFYVLHNVHWNIPSFDFFLITSTLFHTIKYCTHRKLLTLSVIHCMSTYGLYLSFLVLEKDTDHPRMMIIRARI